MNKLSALTALVILFFIGLGCAGVAERFTGKEKLTQTTTLWSDVPPMSGLAHSDLELPWGTKLIIRTALNNLWRVNKEGESNATVEGDWLAMSGTSTPAEIQAFYTKERMASFGKWETNKDSTCIGGKEHGAENGVICLYKKNENGKDTVLAIFAGQDEETKNTNVFYMRLEKSADPAKGNGK